MEMEGKGALPKAVAASAVQQTGVAQPPAVGLGGEAVGRRRLPAEALAIGLLCLALVFTTGWIVFDAAVGGSPLLPYSPYITGWLRHVTDQRLSYRIFFGCLLGFTAAYAALLPLAKRIPLRLLVGLLAVLYILCLIGLVLLSTDLFSYIAYARMGVLHGLNPYVSAPIEISRDPIYPYVGSDWIYTPTAYGPIFTLISYPLAYLGVVGAIWGFKVYALLGCVATCWLVWRAALARGLDGRFALFAFGANPLVVIYSLASFHNDFLMLAVMMVAILLALRAPVSAEGGGGQTEPRRGLRNEAWAGAALIAGTLVKATVAALLPFMILGRRRLGTVVGVAAALALGLLAAYLAFGVHGVDIVSALNRDSMYVSTDSFATEVAHLLGKPGIYPIDHTILKGVLLVIGLYLLWRTWRGYDWVSASGWAMLAITVTSTWLLAWYLIWPLPISLAAKDRRLLAATLFIQLLFVVHQLSPLFTPE